MPAAAICLVRHALVIGALSVGALACGGTPEGHPSPDTAQSVSDTASAEPGIAPGAGPSLPFVGVAIHDSASRWCAAFAADSLSPRETITIVFPDSASRILSLTARAQRRATPCATAFPQLQLAEDAVYDLTVIDAAETGDAAPVAMAVVSDVRWNRGTDGVARADLDGDGIPEEARVCRAHEGQYFTLWKRDAADSALRPVWGRYFDWGAFVDANCRPGEGEEALSHLPQPDEARWPHEVANG